MNYSLICDIWTLGILSEIQIQKFNNDDNDD